MSTENYQNVRSAYSFFHENLGNKIKLQDVSNATGWKDSTVSTYFNKKWKGIILTRVKPGIYRVCMSENMSLEEFGELHSQVDQRLR
ncbi:hypothetical protein [Celerinatantimonas diazotrophica]|uniref:Uncharacterized protein n=1 Tax=Celerinatantimonas diazotrophica TaxID=412034 RepID=A0A4R1J9A2_9GAMM|nr:hypothetical protein [Celerinatantimonas diazotrophica]TCK47166.1 hypothetical protein EV690_2867 [Celerinatantimonas diazotrophica]CAG9295939.1 hypothetical protein CEDIAZO_01073 [Celerinatantimonas diazotrophica]